MAKNDKKNETTAPAPTDTAAAQTTTVSTETSAPVIDDVAQQVTGNLVSWAGPVGAAPASGTETSVPVIPADVVQQATETLENMLGTSGAEYEFCSPRFTVQAVAVPNGRRMRGGQLFTTTPVTVARDDFTDEQWAAILRDPHLKTLPHDGSGEG